MKSIKDLFIATIIVFAFCVFTSSNIAVADTYQIFTLISDSGYNFAGMDSSGNVAISHPTDPVFCGTPTCNIYYNFSDGVLTSTSFTPPTFIPDNGTPCIPTLPPGASAFSGVCNNGREAFSGFLTPGQVIPGIFGGPPFAQVARFSDGLIFMNANGDIVFNDPYRENWNEAIDLTTRATPEPSNLLLFGTGIITVVTSLWCHTRQ